MARGTAALQSQSSKEDEEKEGEGEERRGESEKRKIIISRMRLFCLFQTSLFALYKKLPANTSHFVDMIHFCCERE